MQAIADAGAIPGLVTLLKKGRAQAKEQAAQKSLQDKLEAESRVLQEQGVA